jgi:hypothetical protein
VNNLRERTENFMMADKIKISNDLGSQPSRQKMLLEDIDGRADQVHVLGDLRERTAISYGIFMAGLIRSKC